MDAKTAPQGVTIAREFTLEAALNAKVASLAELGESLVAEKPASQLTLISLGDERVKREAFKTLLPMYSIKAAAGNFGDAEPAEPEGWVDAKSVGRLDSRMFVCRAVGQSMEPTIHDGDFVVMRSNPGGSRQGKTVLAQYRGVADPETGGAYTIKKYSSEKATSETGEWSHTRIVLSPTNPAYKPIVLESEDAGSVKVLAEFVTVLRGDA